jgi:hypothetical protein
MSDQEKIDIQKAITVARLATWLSVPAGVTLSIGGVSVRQAEDAKIDQPDTPHVVEAKETT